jgi:hypothetical protein
MGKANATEERVKPDFRYIAIDETRHWMDENLIKKCGGKIFGIYVFDANSRTYCCELTPSYELNFLRSEPLTLPEDDEERERVCEMVSDADRDTEPVAYYHCRTIDVESCKKCGFEPEEEAEYPLGSDEFREWCASGYEDVPLTPT